jgi:nucleoside-diphosphate-sugar epimerase
VRVVVVGAKGFVGAALVRSLLETGHEVTAVELRDSPGRLADVADHVEWVAGDGSSLETLLAAIGGRKVDAVYYGPYFRRPGGALGVERELDVMAAAAWRVFQLARALDGLRVIFPSSTAVHGPQPGDGAAVSEQTRVAPFGVYGAAKLLTEQVAAEVNEAIGSNRIRCVRLPSVYGPGAETASRSVNASAVAAARGEVARVPYVASLRVCVAHAEDVAEGLRRVLEAEVPAFGLYEMGGLDVSLDEIAGSVAALVPGAETVFGDDSRQVLPNLVDWSRLRDEFQVEHRTLEAGMASVVEYERARSAREG